MPMKPLAHLRPLLRLPTQSTHQPSPEHFSSNPSLLHHHLSREQGLTLNNGYGATQNGAGGSGGGSSAGKAGWGGGAGSSGGGYTGHGRAFLSLPHTGLVDPSTSITSSSSDERQRISSQRSALLLKHRLSRQSQIVEIEEGVGRSVNRQIESRTGSRVGVVELEDKSPKQAYKALENGESQAESSNAVASSSTASPSRSSSQRGRRRSSIAFPSTSASASASVSSSTPGPSRSSSSRHLLSPIPITPDRSPLPSRNSTPSLTHSGPSSPAHSRRTSLHRSRSSLDLWHVGIPRQLSLRSIATRSGPEAVQEQLEDGSALLEGPGEDVLEIIPTRRSPLPSARLLRQPNRVLMDLAGLDLPGLSVQTSKRPLGVRRNSTATMQPTGEGYPDYEEMEEIFPPGPSSGSAGKSHANEQRSNLRAALKEAAESGDADLVQRLVLHYRAPRASSSTSDAGALQDPEILAAFPLPSQYDTNTYNSCISAILQTRRSGQSIASIVEMYNEMLERDCRPSVVTYNLVIEAFAQREMDVNAAVKRWENKVKFDKWYYKAVGRPYRFAGREQQDIIMEGYKAEGNLSNALKLYKILTMLPRDPRSQHPTNVRYSTKHSILEACRGKELTSQELKIVKDMVADDLQVNSAGHLRLSIDQLKVYSSILAYSGDLQGLLELKQRAEEMTQIRQHQQDDIYPFVFLLVLAPRLVKIGKTSEAMEIFDNVLKNAGDSEAMASVFGFTRLTELLVALARQGKFEELKKAHDEFRKVMPWVLNSGDETDTLSVLGYGRIVEALCSKGQGSLAFDLIQPYFYPASSSSATKVSASSSSTAEESVSEEGAAAEDVESGDIPAVSKLPFLHPDRRRMLYAALVQEARDQDSAAAAWEILKKTSSVSRKPVRLHHNDHLLKTHLEVLAKHNRLGEEMLAALQNMEPLPKGSDSKIADDIAKYVKQAMADENVPFTTALSITRKCLSLFRPRWDLEFTELVGSRYLDARRKVSSIKEMTMNPILMVELAQQITQYPLTENNLDEALLQYLEDFGEFFKGRDDAIQALSPRISYRRIVEQTLNRFGEERGVPLLKAALGEERGGTLAENWIESNRRRQEAKAFTAAAVAEAEKSISQDTAPTGEKIQPNEALLPNSDPNAGSSVNGFSIPPPPPYVSTLPPISPKLQGRGAPRTSPAHRAEYKDFLTQRGRSNPAQSAKAFDLVLRNLEQKNIIPLFYMLAKLIDELSRVVGESGQGSRNEMMTRQIYALGYSGLESSREPMEDWAKLENAMITAMCHLGHLEEAGVHRARLLQAGMTPTADSYATMIASSKDTTDDAVVARQLWTESQNLGVRPNLYLYNTIISKLSKARKAEMAIELFKTMKEQGFEPSSVTYGAVINACCRVGDRHSAETLFNEMAAQPSFKPRVPPFNTMMQFHLTTAPNRDAVLHYYNALVRSGVSPSAHTYKLLLDAYAVLPPVDTEAVERVFNELIADRSVKVQGTHWASVISAFGIYSSDPARAQQLFDSIPSHPMASIDVAAEPVVWEAMLNVLAAKSTTQAMNEMYQRMIASGAKITAYVNNVMINGFARGQEIEKARNIFNTMADSMSGVAAPNNHPQLLTSSGHAKPSTISQQESGLVYKEPSTYEAMIRAELTAGTKENAELVLKQMEERGYPIAVFMKAQNLINDHLTQKANQASLAELEAPRTSMREVQGTEPPKELNYTSSNPSATSASSEVYTPPTSTSSLEVPETPSGQNHQVEAKM